MRPAVEVAGAVYHAETKDQASGLFIIQDDRKALIEEAKAVMDTIADEWDLRENLGYELLRALDALLEKP